MRLDAIKAQADPAGNRIDLSWQVPEGGSISGVLVKRRAGTHPESPNDGQTLSLNADGRSVTDTALDGGTVYYYMLFPFQGAPPVYSIDTHNRAAAMATSPEDFSGYMHSLLPGIYRRYDNKLPPTVPIDMAPEDAQRALLERFLDLPGGQVDQLHSAARSIQTLHNIQTTHGGHLPRLAEWIAWRTDFRQEYRGQRNEIRNAPSIYRTIGLIPTVEATVKRITAWESRTKEFVHNVFRSNQPERLNLWAALRDAGGTWSFPGSTPVSLDHTYEGCSTTAIDSNNVRWLFYHTDRLGNWEIWCKTSERFPLAPGFAASLAEPLVSLSLQNEFEDSGFPVSRDATITQVGSVWRIADPGADTFLVEVATAGFTVYRIVDQPLPLSESTPIGAGTGFEKYPSTTLQDARLWLFWSSYDEERKHWRTHYRYRDDAQWRPIDEAPTTGPFSVGGAEPDDAQRKQPSAVTDDSNRLWLFWLEYTGDRWQLKYNRREPGIAGTWGTPVEMPLDGGVDPRIQNDVKVAVRPGAADNRLLVFWSRQTGTAADPARLRWEIAYRVKDDLALDAANWSPVATLPKAPVDGDFHDREPYPVVVSGNVELYYASNRGNSGWSVWNSSLSNLATNSWTVGSRVTDAVFSQRSPLPIPVADTMWLFYRGNRSVPYESGVFTATKTFDGRYSGSTAADARHTAKTALRSEFEDIGTYTYDAGNPDLKPEEKPGNDDWYARDTVGLYLDNDTFDDEEIQASVNRLQPVLADFMPMTDRAVFIARADLHTEYVYTYGLPAGPNTYVIGETFVDSLTSSAGETVLSPGEDFVDTLSP